MTAAYRLKGIGWFAVLVGVVLGFYVVSLRVAAERKKLDTLNARIVAAQRDIRALETEFDTRANFQQLERWNGDTLALVAPTAAQFVTDDAALAALDPAGLGEPQVQTAAMVVPAWAPSQVAPQPAVMPAVARVSQPAPAMISPAPRTPAPAAVRVAAASPRAVTITPAAVRIVAPTGRSAPAIARLTEAARGAVAVAKVRPQAVAMLDRQLLSDTTFGDIMSGARREARH
jgi:hypothetical protein